MLNNPKAEAPAYRGLAQAYASIKHTNGLQGVVAKLTPMVKAEPTNYAASAGLAQAYRELGDTAHATQTLDQMVAKPNVNASGLLQAAEEYAALRDFAKLESTLEKLVQVVPGSPEGWYDLAALKSTMGKTGEALAPLKKAIELSNSRQKQNQKGRDLLVEAQKDPRFNPLHTNPEFTKLVSSK